MRYERSFISRKVNLAECNLSQLFERSELQMTYALADVEIKYANVTKFLAVCE